MRHLLKVVYYKQHRIEITPDYDYTCEEHMDVDWCEYVTLDADGIIVDSMFAIADIDYAIECAKEHIDLGVAACGA